MTAISQAQYLWRFRWPAFAAASLYAILVFGSTTGHADPPQPTAVKGARSCAPSSKISPICGLSGPEDIALLKDERTLVVSELPPDFAHPQGSGLMLADLVTNRARPLRIRIDREDGWGDATCSAPPKAGFSTHGLHVSQRTDGRTELLAVNHAGGDSIEAFELVKNAGDYQAVWRGCAPFAEGLFNGVAALPDGGFIATVMLDKTLLGDKNPWDFLFSGEKTGYLVEWHPDKGYARLPNSEAALNNGVQISRDGRFIYFAAYTARQLHRYDRTLQRITASVDTSFYPDNISVQEDGRLMVTGIDDLTDFKECRQAEGAFCSKLLPFTVANFDPQSMKVTLFYHGAAGTLAGASVALRARGRLYISTYTGDRLISVKLPRENHAW
jgi:hypothetical protein